MYVFLEKLRDVLEKECLFNKVTIRTHKNNKASDLIYSGNRQAFIFYKWLYKDCRDLYLKRKKDKFEEIIRKYAI